MRPLRGILPPVVTPFDSDGALDLAAFEANLEAWAGEDLEGYVVLGSNGEAASLEEDEKLALVRAARARASGRALLVGTGLDSTRATIALTRRVADKVSIPVVASGGVGSLEHLAAGLLEGGADAALAASIFHDGEHTIGEAKAFLVSRGVRVRPPLPPAGPEGTS